MQQMRPAGRIVEARMVNRSFAERIRNAERLLGTVASFPSPEVAETLALCGFDWLLVDAGQAGFDTLMVQRMLQASRCPALIRVAGADPKEINCALDVGATGVIVPGIRLAEDVERVIAACRYPPLGNRAVGMVRAQGYGQNFKSYLNDANDEIVIVPQIDNIDAVREIEAIAALSGFNALFVDPYGISASVGRPGQLGHTEVTAAIGRVQHFCEDAERRCGIFAHDLDSAAKWLGAKFNLVAVTSDAMMLGQRARDVLQVLR
jgi:2-keto-3-deoxy-L-rhamnonate aldolase RhmA